MITLADTQELAFDELETITGGIEPVTIGVVFLVGCAIGLAVSYFS